MQARAARRDGMLEGDIAWALLPPFASLSLSLSPSRRSLAPSLRLPPSLGLPLSRTWNQADKPPTLNLKR